jgi:hypothetical protein
MLSVHAFRWIMRHSPLLKLNLGYPNIPYDDSETGEEIHRECAGGQAAVENLFQRPLHFFFRTLSALLSIFFFSVALRLPACSS